MKRFFTSLSIFAAIIANAQIPTGYYDTANGEGYELKTQLYNIIKNHTTKTYGDLWSLYKNYPEAFNDNWYDETDRNKILDMYSENPNGPDAYTYNPGTNQCGNYSRERDCYNREHIIPQSVFSQNSPMVSDPFHIWPTDGYVNGKRANYPFGVVENPTWTSLNGSKLGSNYNSGYSAGYSGTVFEPIDEFKGDIARSYFYFVTRYQENGIQNWNYAMFDGETKDKVFTQTFLNILYQWHINDPVSPREIAINEAIYDYQNNRNPFIDHPEFVEKIWKTNLSTIDQNISSAEFKVVKVKPNTYRISPTDFKENNLKIEVYSAEGQLIKTETLDLHTNFEFSLQNKGLHIIKIFTNHLKLSKKIVN